MTWDIPMFCLNDEVVMQFVVDITHNEIVFLMIHSDIVKVNEVNVI